MKVPFLFFWFASCVFAASVITTTGSITQTGIVQSVGGSFTAPNAAINLMPVNSDTHVVAETASMLWQNGGGALNYDVYLDTANPPTTVVSSAQSGTTYAPTVAASTQYYWKIRSRNAVGTTDTTVYTFTTATPYTVTTFVDFEDGTIGAVPTTTNLANSTDGAAGTWTRSTNAETYSEINAQSHLLYTPVKIGGTIYQGTGTRGVRFRIDQEENYIRNTFASPTDTFSFACDILLGSQDSLSQLDVIHMASASGGFAVVQRSSTGRLRSHWGGGGFPSDFGTGVTVASDTRYRVEVIGIRNSNSSTLKIYSEAGTLLHSENFLLTGAPDSPFVYIGIGRMDAHGPGPPDTSWVQFDNVAWSTTGVNPIAP